MPQKDPPRTDSEHSTRDTHQSDRRASEAGVAQTSSPADIEADGLAGDATSGSRARKLERPSWQRALLLAAGSLALTLGVLGIFLPLLPTTPLVLLAGFCFARGSRRAHSWLRDHRLFGRIVREWEEHRRIPERAKWIGIALVFAAFSLSVLFLPNCVYGYVTLFVLGSGLVIFLAALPTVPRSEGARH